MASSDAMLYFAAHDETHGVPQRQQLHAQCGDTHSQLLEASRQVSRCRFPLGSLVDYSSNMTDPGSNRKGINTYLVISCGYGV